MMFRTSRSCVYALSMLAFAASSFPTNTSAESVLSAEELIQAMIEQTRSSSSYTELTMLVNRENWRRSSQFSVWTRGQEDALIRFTAPPKDAGNATLKVGNIMWTYSPSIRRSIRLPRSMMAQDWQGSDISYNDLARSDDVLDNYEIEVVTIEEREGRSVYWLDAIPGEETPVVWGKESFEIKVIDDEYVLLSQTFYDQDMNPVKRWKTLEIGELGGRTIPLKMRMYNVDETESWTQIEYNIAEFDIDVDDRLFTQFALRGEL